MKSIKKFGVALSAAAMVATLFAVPAIGQTVGATTCVVPSGTITVGVPATFTATGGNGNFTWSASDLTISNPIGASFTATYATPGAHTLTVTSNGQVSSCTFNVAPAAAASGPTVCAPSSQAATVGQQVTFTASGGNGSYTWSASDLTISNPTGATFRATYGSAGVHSVTVTSNGTSSTCVVNVTAAGTVPGGSPGLPNTGFAPVN